MSTRWFENSVVASINSGWLDRDEFAADGRSKRFKAILNVWKKVSLHDENPFNTMAVVSFFAPSLNDAGRVMRTPPTGVVIYLSPTLELDAQHDVDHAVAHEIAHVSLGHHLAGNAEMQLTADTHEKRPAEIAADKLATRWGFPRRKRGTTEFVKMVTTWAKRKGTR